MKQYIIFFAFLVLALGRISAIEPDINVMSFNIRCDTSSDGENAWKNRKDMVADAVNFYCPDVVGMQEVRPVQLADLVSRLTDYGHVGIGRNNHQTKAEHCTIWYRKDNFQLVDSGNFWLSEHPDMPGSRGWDSYCERIATWVRLKHLQTDKEFIILNTHLDHKGKIARREGARLLLSKSAELSADNIPIIMTGDFNAEDGSEPIEILKTEFLDSRRQSSVVYGPAWTFHNFGRLSYDKRELIDYVFLKGPVVAKRYGVLAEMENEKYLSDHAPILVNVLLTGD